MSERMTKSWSVSNTAKSLATADMMPSHTLEQKITKLHIAVETILNELLAMMILWSKVMREHKTEKFHGTLAMFIKKAADMKAILPQKYVLDPKSDLANVTPSSTPSLIRKVEHDAPNLSGKGGGRKKAAGHEVVVAS